ncbi:hypothetical protein AB833_03295 [Chromatiales bacterium (ex Bugula neritina AB1)]|nr:hypothetical protein AB833_03295 [Chromatiales bacterium (ex Bugula neritina AB1)]
MSDNNYLNTPFNLSGKTAMVTGASGGLGSRFAHTLASAGANLVVAARDVNNAALLELEHSLESRVGVKRVAIDVADKESISNSFSQAMAAFGSVDILINNAGVASPEAALKTDDALWQGVIGTNLSGAWYVAREFATRLVTLKRPGALVNITSILGQRVSTGVMSYAVSKAGLEQMTRSLSLEWARHRIRVNSLAPGYIVTNMNRDYLNSSEAESMINSIPQRRVGEPGDLDGAVLLLASDASGFMTGSTIVVDGGHLQSSL